MFKSISTFEIDDKSRLVTQLPISGKSDEKAASLRDKVRKIAEGVLGGMPKAKISISNDVSDTSSLVRIDKYEFIINDLSEGRKVLTMRAHCEDPYDPREIDEFVSVMEAAKEYLKGQS
ncbi:hypothetical protein M1567_03275 [Candidatus Marsarchaeota archaeon]|nr:hypothetical protein [Candidatus Marsarchaeota archaeon]